VIKDRVVSPATYKPGRHAESYVSVNAIHSFNKYMRVYYVPGPVLSNGINFVTIVTKVASQKNKVFLC
jgi:hypothetical protein